jgi:hypothetical protein
MIGSARPGLKSAPPIVNRGAADYTCPNVALQSSGDIP